MHLAGGIHTIEETYNCYLTGLSPNTMYYIRSYATNSEGTSYGNKLSFTTLSYPASVTDYDGNTYQTILIGSQVWMASNLKVTHYRNGDPIPNITDNTQWSNFSTGAYCNYNNSNNSVITYGRLYNGYAVHDSRNIAPTGWHIPTDTEWFTLFDYLGGTSVAGGKLKETGTLHWLSPNTGATNESAFTALPGGFRFNLGGFYNIGAEGHWWSSSENGTASTWYLYHYDSNAHWGNYIKSSGFSVRCIMDL